MKLVSPSAKDTLSRSTKPLSSLDDAEMLLTLNELGEMQHAPAQSLVTPELVAEYASAASMIMDKEEREAIARELLHALHPHPVAA